MGGGPTKNIINEATSVVNNIITSVVSTTDQSAVVTIRSTQINKLNMGGNFKFDCPNGINICLSNSSDISSQMVTNFQSQAVTQIKTALLTDITNQNSQLMKIVNGFLSFLDAGGSDTNETNVRNMVSNYINNSINISTIQSSVQAMTSLQENEVNMFGNYQFEGAQCNFVLTNDFQGRQVLLAVAKNIVNNFVSNNIVNKVTNRASQTMDVKNEGIDSALYGAAALAIACGVFYVLQGIGTRIAAKGAQSGGSGGSSGGSSGSFKKVLVILFVVVIIGIIGLWLYNQYSKKNWPFTPDYYYGCKIGTFTDPATGAKSIVNVDGCVQYTKNDNRGIYKSLQECQDKQTDPSNGTCGQFWGCQYDSNKKLTNTCEQYPSAYYTIDWTDNTKTQIDATYMKASDCETSCPSKWTCAMDSNGFAVEGQCRQVTDPFEIAQICLLYNPNSSQCANFVNPDAINNTDTEFGSICSKNQDNNGSPLNVKVPLFDTQEDCVNDPDRRCATTWTCSNPGAKSNACTQSACPVPCDPSNPNCFLGTFADKQSCINSCNASSVMLGGDFQSSPCFQKSG
jgi:hypothetical protein